MVIQRGEKPRLLLLGDARQVHLVRWCKYFLDAGYEVLTLSLEQVSRFPGEYRHVRISPALPSMARYWLARPVVRRFAARFRPHLVNAHFLPNYGFVASSINLVPWVLSTWGSDIMTNPDRSPFHLWRTKRVLSRATFVTSDADVMTARIRSFGVPAEKILTFPYGVDTSVFFPLDEPPAGGPHVLSNRKLDAVYSVSTLIDAFPGVHEALPEATLTIAGEGELRTELMRRAEGYIGGPSIIFVGGVDHDRMPILLRENHIYVSTALSDTTSVSLLEAMACGLFPIVSDIPANREWITHGENGLLVPVQQPMQLAMTIVEAWRDRDLVRRARDHNLQLIRSRGEWRNNMRGVHELFDGLVGAK